MVSGSSLEVWCPAGFLRVIKKLKILFFGRVSKASNIPSYLGTTKKKTFICVCVSDCGSDPTHKSILTRFY